MSCVHVSTVLSMFTTLGSPNLTAEEATIVYTNDDEAVCMSARQISLLLTLVLRLSVQNSSEASSSEALFSTCMDLCKRIIVAFPDVRVVLVNHSQTSGFSEQRMSAALLCGLRNIDMILKFHAEPENALCSNVGSIENLLNACYSCDDCDVRASLSSSTLQLLFDKLPPAKSCSFVEQLQMKLKRVIDGNFRSQSGHCHLAISLLGVALNCGVCSWDEYAMPLIRILSAISKEVTTHSHAASSDHSSKSESPDLQSGARAVVQTLKNGFSIATAQPVWSFDFRKMVVQSLNLLLERCLDEDVLVMSLELLRRVLLVPIPKKGDTSDRNNYRGIALFHTTQKLLDKILAKRLSRTFRVFRV